MASKERESTGMSLISSMYSDDEDDEMEDVPDRTKTTHEEGVATSPEAEDDEIMGTAGKVGSEELQMEISEIQGNFVSEISQVLKVSIQENVQLSTQLNPSLSENLSNAVCEAEFGPMDVVSVEVQAEVNPLSTFLPPPPSTKCSDELQMRINKFLELKRGGKSYNTEVRNKKEYRNPDFLVHAVTYQDIDQIGSCFNKDVFDPHGYDKNDFYDEIVVAASGMPSIPASSSDGVGRDGRQNKKSKWDKVDNERRNPLINIRLLQ